MGLNLYNFEDVKSRLTIILKNSDFIKSSDFDIIKFQVVNDVIACPQITDGNSSMFITKGLMKKWNKREDEVFKCAMENLRDSDRTPLVDIHQSKVYGHSRIGLMILESKKLKQLLDEAVGKVMDSYLVSVSSMRNIKFAPATKENFMNEYRRLASNQDSIAEQELVSRTPFLLYEDRVESFHAEGFDPRQMGMLAVWKDEEGVLYVG